MVMIDYDNDDDDDNDGDAFFASWPVLVEPSPLAQASGLVGVVAKKKTSMKSTPAYSLVVSFTPVSWYSVILPPATFVGTN